MSLQELKQYRVEGVGVACTTLSLVFKFQVFSAYKYLFIMLVSTFSEAIALLFLPADLPRHNLVSYSRQCSKTPKYH